MHLNGDVSQMAKEAEIKDAIELQDSPESNKTILESVFKKRNKTGNKQTLQRGKKKKKQLHHDPDISLVIKQHGEENVHIVYDSNP